MFRCGFGGGGGNDSLEEGREIAGIDEFVFGHHAGAADDVFQFADVAGPGVTGEDGLGAGGDAADVFRVFAGVSFDEGADEVGEVFHAFSEGWEVEFDHGEPVVKIFAEIAGGHHRFQISVGGGDDAEGDFFRGVGTDGFDFLLLDGAEEFGLHGEGEVAEFIEEEGAAVGGFEDAFFVVCGAGEGAFEVAEHFAFEERFGDGGAVADDEGTGVDGALAMECGGGEFFAGAGGSADEGDAIVGGDAADHGEHFEHLGAVADHAFEAMGLGEGGFEASGFEAFLEFVEELANASAEVSDVERFG